MNMKRSYILLGVFALLLFIALPFLASDDSDSQAEPVQASVKTVASSQSEQSKRIQVQTDSRIALKNFLKDSNSAEIRNHNGNCGEVNSKNSFGGYTGFKRFIASPTIVAVEGENMNPEEFQKAWNQVC
ncbi:hypothetical protein KTI07_00520 [Acinetobacter lwoffii]|uniref:Uncharacterized protein n=2 Tax=Moraxellaceae TaxID=468 RepID=A0ABR8VW58_9GAMM|nr:hypothetical protein [Acinetobacter pecorum]MCU4438017.1 hypothetical protein [Acinetobacter lwoffii]